MYSAGGHLTVGKALHCDHQVVSCTFVECAGVQQPPKVVVALQANAKNSYTTNKARKTMEVLYLKRICEFEVIQCQIFDIKNPEAK